MDNRTQLLQLTLVIMALLGLAAFSAGVYFLLQYLGDEQRAILMRAEKCILWGFWPAFFSLILAIRYKQFVSRRHQLLSLTPTLELLLLAAVIYYIRWF